MTMAAARAAALWLTIGAPQAGMADGSVPSSTASLLEVIKPDAVEISPDGRSVAYTVVRTQLAQNRYSVDLYVTATEGSGASRLLQEARWISTEPYGFPALTWTPDNRALVYVAWTADGQKALYRRRLDGGQEELIALESEMPKGARFPTQKLTFSPDGESLAFIAAVPSSPPDTSFQSSLVPAQANAQWMPEATDNGRKVVMTMDWGVRKFRALTGPELKVISFWDSGVTWSPNGRFIAFAAAAAVRGMDHTQAAMISDIYIVDTEGEAKPRRIVHMPGCDRDPAWSPDGTTLAFVSQEGVDGYFFGNTIAMVPATGGTTSFPGREARALSGGPLWNLQWTRDGKTLYFQGFYHLTHQVFRLPLASSAARSVTPVLPDEWFYGQVSYSSDRSHIAFSRENAVTPPDIQFMQFDETGSRTLTRLNMQWDERAAPTVRHVKWRSGDDKWDLHGLLLLPRAAAGRSKLPLLTTIMGGPVMVANRFNLSDAHYPLLALAAKDYAVFLPNTRGREGYGEDFSLAVKSEESYVLNPTQDVLSGIDHLVEQGVADAKRLAIAGFSYGGTLAAYLITATDRFKAAVYGGGSPDLLLGNFERLDLPWRLPLMRDLRGTRDPFDPETITRDFAQTALFRLDRVRTPVLIESGSGAAGADAETDRVFFIGLQRFGVPSEWLVYPRSGHGWSEPALRLESYRRVKSWLDYWVMNRPYRDNVRQRQYDDWKKSRSVQSSFTHSTGG